MTAANTGDTVEVRPEGTYTQQVVVEKRITLQGDPSSASPLLSFAPTSSQMPALKFTNAATGSTLRHFDVQSDGSAVDDAIVFEQDFGTITDVSATATGDASAPTATK